MKGGEREKLSQHRMLAGRTKPGLALSPDEGRTQQYKAMYEGMCHATKYLVIIAAAKWPSAVPIVHHTARRDAQTVPTQAALQAGGGGGVGVGGGTRRH